jgi:tetratricopeptide (TPR) repeat protein
VLIWGVVLRQEGKSAPRLYWTTLHDGKRAKEPYQPKNFQLPDLFWNDLVEVLRLVVVTHASTLHAQEGHFIAAQLPPFIGRVRQLLKQSSRPHEWHEVQFSLGNTLLTLGEQSGAQESLEDAVQAYQEVLQAWTREQMPLQWAMTQHNLGTALQLLGEREAGTTHLEEAVQAYRAALQEHTREQVPLAWAMTQNNLGSTLRILGEQTKEGLLLCEALESHSAAWEVFTQASAHYASVAVHNVEQDIEALKRGGHQSYLKIVLEDIVRFWNVCTSSSLSANVEPYAILYTCWYRWSTHAKMPLV